MGEETGRGEGVEGVGMECREEDREEGKMDGEKRNLYADRQTDRRIHR